MTQMNDAADADPRGPTEWQRDAGKRAARDTGADEQAALRILIVDDNPLDRAEAKAALLNGSSRRYQFIEAASAGDALRLCTQPPLPDCLVLDLGLPDADNMEVLTQLPRDEDHLLRVPVVVLTGVVGPGLNQAALRAGAHDYVGKAWLRPETLTQAVENAIERLGMARTLQTQRHLADASRITQLRLEGENRQIQEASRLKSQFLANMSHELRTPLNAIIGFSDLLHSGAVQPEMPQHQVFLGHICSSGRHLLQLINDVLDLSRVEAGKFEFFPEALDLPVLVKEVNDILHTQIQRKRLRITADIDPTLVDLWLDPGRLKQVLYNYLSNAIKFTPHGGSITVRARAEGDSHFRLEVEDTGIGIAPSDLPRLFTEYQQLDGGFDKQQQGAGLGLALTRHLVEAQNGSVGVRSILGRGSVFHLLLNRVHGSHEPSPGAGVDPLGNAAGRRFLVIQHDREPFPQLGRALASAGFQVDAAGTGECALQRASGQQFDAITLDLLLPDQCGLAVLEQIRREGPNRASPVVGMTMAADSGAAATFAIADVLCKPIRIDEVISAMARFRLPGTRPTRVMVIDDDPLALDLMSATLKAIGIDAVCLADGRQALDEIDRHRPDAIVLDLVMPQFDGFAVLEALRHLPVWRDTPVFIWTSLLLTDAEYADLSRSARAVLSKGGGTLDATLDALRRWHPAVALPTTASTQ